MQQRKHLRYLCNDMFSCAALYQSVTLCPSREINLPVRTSSSSPSSWYLAVTFYFTCSFMRKINKEGFYSNSASELYERIALFF